MSTRTGGKLARQALALLSVYTDATIFGPKAAQTVIDGFVEDGCEMEMSGLPTALAFIESDFGVALRIMDYLGLDDVVEFTLDFDVLEQIAEFVATKAHAGQVDKEGVDYIEHPRTVVGYVSRYGPIARIIAWLHDTVEDTDVTLAFLSSVFPPVIVDGVDAMTHRKGETNDGYLARVAANDEATLVKIKGDIRHNADPARLAKLKDLATRNRLTTKYHHAEVFIASWRLSYGMEMP